MSWPHTRGGMIEMRAMCLLYRRNLRIHEFNKPSMVITYSKQFRQLFTIYYTSQHHFDIVYTNAYYKTAAAAQAISYKLIFKQLLRMPDVELAVQHMLFPGTYKKSSVIHFGDKLVFRNGHSIQLDKPQQTNCMLNNELKCSFHNGHSSVSCMRKLLHDHCVPFSFQVAKSLHPQFYRNVELDVYRGTNLHVGDKCVVSIAKRFFDCYIQSIDLDARSCFVYVVHWCQMVKVSLSKVRRSPLDEFRQWTQKLLHLETQKQQQPQTQLQTQKQQHLETQKEQQLQTQKQPQQSPFNFDAISSNSEEKILMSNCLGCVSWTQVLLFTKTAAQFSSGKREQSMLPLKVHQEQHLGQLQQSTTSTFYFAHGQPLKLS
ncbi:protein ovarian tumor locus [Drosophila nasuta]|uniref:protein ovarian tumor locus n=1 Tax=Drosophila nasuta TaxID=42062 RepID=UPI00295F427B|nr:protein ovarian tumor locus [Drosophila nasuta]